MRRVVTIGSISVATVALIAYVGLDVLRTLQNAGKPTPAILATLLRDAVESWRAVHHDAGCPSVEQLQSGQLLDPTELPPSDSWGRQYVIRCVGDSIQVVSGGPDRMMGTPDDVIVR